MRRSFDVGHAEDTVPDTATIFIAPEIDFFLGQSDAGIVLREAENVQNRLCHAFPTVFRVEQFEPKILPFICPLWGQFLLRTASIDIMAPCTPHRGLT